MSSELAEEIRGLIDGSMSLSTRSLYGKTALGVSDVGHCREYARRVIQEYPQEQEQTHYSAAFMGTAIGDLLEKQYALAHPGALIQNEVVAQLYVRGVVLHLVGHPDVIDREANRVIDFKTVDGLGMIRDEPTLQQKFQVTLYAKACCDEGLIEPDCSVALVYVDRSGADPEVIVHEWDFDNEILLQAIEWLDDVIYAVENNEEASRDKPRSWCENWCEFAPSCRGTDTDVEGLITDPFILDAVRVYKDSAAAMNAAEKDKKSAESVLRDVVGNTGEWSVRWVSIPGGHVEFDRKAYSRLSITAQKKPKRGKGE